MKLSFSTIYNYRYKIFHHTRWATMDRYHHHHRPKQRIVVLMGATGTGKSRLSIDIASRFPSEIINADKIQLYSGLDITTNKIPMPDRRGVPHHLLGEFDPDDGEILPADYRSIASDRISQIITRRRLPVIAGGSNSFIHALLSEHYDPEKDCIGRNSFGSGVLRYNCCFIWVHVARHVLEEYLSRRVDDMLDSGMFEELAGFFSSSVTVGSEPTGLLKAIGVPEFERYFQRYGGSAHSEGDLGRTEAYEEAVEAIKENTYQLAERQIQKIQWLRSTGWDLKVMDATNAFRAVLESDDVRYREAWEKDVMSPSMKVVKQFLDGAVC
ncbi:adenylate isopentenyltransferase-like [Magnolia sinica]|uniref:adenylate isopentenyltransferase-like n=1 Tax=Magnolia sinica TaxID=86752 RepID=UPI0026590A75|nr:adenylate isopentenyltransferase-like [Magnolia sinica]